jgi:hypothetical protein
MDDAPTAGPANTVAAFQTNTVFVNIQRFIYSVLASDDAVAYTEISGLAGSPD